MGKRYWIFMERALELAGNGRGQTSPNPMVGAVVVKDGSIIGEGYHRRAGEAHAETLALEAAGAGCRGADLYTNLEPCSHYGRTPPCAEGIIAAGIRRVFIAAADPNPKVNGRGITLLREKGIEVNVGLMERESKKLNEAYFKYITTGRPFVVLKMALSLDGKMATRTGDSKWITSEESRKKAHAMRGEADGVMIGVGTLLRDDPLLNIRMIKSMGRQPKRVIADSHLRTPLTSKLLRDSPHIETIVATTEEAPKKAAESLKEAGVDIIYLPAGPSGVDLGRLLDELASRQITSLLVEGGARLFTSFLNGGLADKIVIFIAPLIIGGEKALSPFLGEGAETMAESLRLRDTVVETLAEEVVVSGYL